MNLFNTGYGEKTKITNSKTITEEGKYALDAYQNNPAKPDTLAYQISHKLDIVDGAAAHNAHPRGINLLTIMDKDEMFGRIADGTFKDEYIGDYFDITISTEYTANEPVRCLFSVFDPYLNMGDTPLTRHHVGIVPQNCFAKTHQMNSTNTTVNGYANAAINAALGKYANAIAVAIGQSHLITHRSLLTKGISETGASMGGAGFIGCSNSWEWKDIRVQLLSEAQVHGNRFWSSSGYDGGIDTQQLPLFRLNPAARICKLGGVDDVNASNRQWWWLRDVASTVAFSFVDKDGSADSHSASYSGGVRPFFLIG